MFEAPIIRHPRPGELGWIVRAHGVYCAREFGCGIAFGGLVARIVADFAARMPDPSQRCFIAAVNEEPVGSAMLSRDPDGAARLRIMLVDDSVRGRGVGRMLGAAVLQAARELGDESLVLWTTDRQQAARRLYRRMGFRLVASAPNTSFAPGAQDETWRLALQPLAR